MDMSWQDAEFAEAWAKAMENNEELTRSEMIQVSGHLWAFIDQLNSARRLIVSIPFGLQFTSM